MDIRFLKAVKEYTGALSRIAVFTFFVGYLAIMILRWQIPLIDAFLAEVFGFLPEGIDTITILNIPLLLGAAIPAALIALIFRMFKAHDLISDLFEIRQQFDVKHILLPLARGSGVSLSLMATEQVRRKRKNLMETVFYQNLSAVPEQLKTLAIDQWSWYWCLVEMEVIAALTILALLLGGAIKPALWIFVIFIVILFIMPGLKFLCARYAQREVDHILADTQRKDTVAGAFRALPS